MSVCVCFNKKKKKEISTFYAWAYTSKLTQSLTHYFNQTRIYINECIICNVNKTVWIQILIKTDFDMMSFSGKIKKNCLIYINISHFFNDTKRELRNIIFLIIWIFLKNDDIICAHHAYSITYAIMLISIQFNYQIAFNFRLNRIK